jgi:hypothetical protein
VQLPLYFLALIGPPIAISIANPSLIRALVVSTFASWAGATAATYWFLKRDDGDPITMLIWFFVLVLPAATTVPAAFVATRLVRPRGQLIPALGMALLGFMIALCVLLGLAYLGHIASDDDLVASAIVVAMPAIYAACGAAYAAHLSGRRI